MCLSVRMGFVLGAKKDGKDNAGHFGSIRNFVPAVPAVTSSFPFLTKFLALLYNFLKV